MNHCKLR